MIINTQFYRKSFPRVLCFILMKDILYKVPSGKRLGEWRKNETKSIQRETNTTTPGIEE